MEGGTAVKVVNVVYSEFYRAARSIYNAWLKEGRCRPAQTRDRLDGVRLALKFALKRAKGEEFDKLNAEFMKICGWYDEAYKAHKERFL